MKTEYQYIRFDARSPMPGHATVKYDCRNIRHGSWLGVVAFSGAWRQYVFQSTPSCECSAGCLRDIAEFCEALTADWREAQRLKRTVGCGEPR